MNKPIVLGKPLGIPALHRFLCAAWLTLYMAWVWIAPSLLEARGHREDAAWVGLFFIPTMEIGALIGGLTIWRPKWYTVIPFAICTFVHAAFGMGNFPH